MVTNAGILIAAPPALGERVRDMLTGSGLEVLGTCISGGDLLRRVQAAAPALVVVSYRLSDGMGADAAVELSRSCGVLLLVNEQQQALLPELPNMVVCVTLPTNQLILTQAAHIVIRMSEQVQALTRRINELTRSREEHELVSQAKALLMRQFNLSEPQAHKRMQALSMESGKRITEVARIVLEQRAD